MTKTSTLGRIQVIQGTPPALPGKCVVCGTTQGPVIDIGFEIDFYGVVYFCKTCIQEVANSLGYLSPEQHRELLDDLLEAGTRIGLLEEERVVIKNALRLDFGELASIIGDSDVSVDSPDKTIEEPEPAIDESEQGPLESDNEQGSSDLLDDDDNSTERPFTI